jgi:hypothetical protein
MVQTIAFFILTVMAVVALGRGLFLVAYLAIACLRKNTNPKQLIRLKKNGAILGHNDCFERRVAYPFTTHCFHPINR